MTSQDPLFNHQLATGERRRHLRFRATPSTARLTSASVKLRKGSRSRTQRVTPPQTFANLGRADLRRSQHLYFFTNRCFLREGSLGARRGPPPPPCARPIRTEDSRPERLFGENICLSVYLHLSLSSLSLSLSIYISYIYIYLSVYLSIYLSCWCVLQRIMHIVSYGLYERIDYAHSVARFI